MSRNNRRRWFAYSLRTLLVLTTAVACWLGYAKHWINQRREFLSTHNLVLDGPFALPAKPTTAPWGLWLFGEEGRSGVTIWTDQDSGQQQQLESLFPEATIGVIVIPSQRSPSDKAPFDAAIDGNPELRPSQLLPARDRQALINDLK